MNKILQYHLICPFCGKGELLADEKGKVTVSVQCPKCKNYFKADLDAMKTERAQAQPRMGLSFKHC